MTITSYTYNPDGLRNSKTQNGNTTKFYWDRGYMSAESMGGTFTAKNHIGAIGIFARETSTGIDYMLKNGHGDVTTLVNNGIVTQTYDYDAYGNQMNENENDINPFRYCGEYLDNETGLTYLRNRYYDNAIGRFITQDPIKDGLNWYAYCKNNPVMFVDPWGTYYIKDNGNGTYTGVKHNFVTSLIASVCSVYVPSSIQSYVEREWFNYVGGNSATKEDIVADAADFAIEKMIENIGKYGKKIFKIISAGEAITKTYSGHKILDYDNISFGLLSRAGVSLTSTDKKQLENIMSKTYGFIDNISYFTEGMGEIFRGASAHQIDYEISQASNPQQVIKSYKNRAYSFYCSYGYKSDVAIGMANNVETYLESYNERRTEIFDIFTDYINAE